MKKCLHFEQSIFLSEYKQAASIAEENNCDNKLQQYFHSSVKITVASYCLHCRLYFKLRLERNVELTSKK